MKDLLVAVPSRSRPASIARLRDAMQETCTAGTTLLVGQDDDDMFLAAYPDGPQYVTRGGLRQAGAWFTELAVPRTGDYRAIAFLGDDNVPRTRGWDTALLAALEDTPFAFGNDQYPGREPGALCCHVVMRSEVIAVLGYAAPPSLRHMYIDDVWMAWGQACGITYLDSVIIEHLHYTSGKAPSDASYLASSALLEADKAAFGAYCGDGGKDGLAADIARIREVL